jgi:hypothetical protein
LLSAIKDLWKERVTTVFVKQGHYANDPATEMQYPPADIKLDRIGDLLDYNREAFLQR